MVKDSDNSSILEELHRDEEQLHRDEKRIKIAFILGMIFVLILISAASYVVIQSIAANKSTQTIIKEIPTSISIAPTAAQSSALSAPTSAPITIPSTTKATKDYYINIGTGTNKSLDWADVDGAITTADLGQYGNVKEIHLETNINVPTANGTISVRLFNKTDGYAVWNSERTVEAQAQGPLLISQNLIYDKSPKLYQVQMKSQLGVTANLIQSRIHIVTR